MNVGETLQRELSVGIDSEYACVVVRFDEIIIGISADDARRMARALLDAAGALGGAPRAN